MSGRIASPDSRLPFYRRRRIGSWPRSRRAIVAIAVAIVTALVVGLVGYNVVLRLQHLTKLEDVPPGSTVSVPPTRPVILIVLENKTQAEILRATDAPYLDHLIERGAEMTDYQAIAHPSQPNYLAIFSGSTHGVIDDEPHDIGGPSIADQLDAAGGTWRVFAENLPASPCFTGAESTDGPDGPGVYVRKHDPAMSFTAITGSPGRCSNVQPLGRFRPDAADFIWVVPNMCHIMHECSIAEGDAWLSTFVPKILDSAAFRPGGHGVLYLTFDEGSDRSRNNEIVTVVVGPDVPAGTTSGVAHSHYSLLRTIETGLGLPCLANACGANTMGEAFRR
jgi:hypothetical protein